MARDYSSGSSAHTKALFSTEVANLTLAAWIKILSNPGSDKLVVYNGTMGTNGYGIIATAAGGGALQTRVVGTTIGGAVVSLNTWHHAALRRSGSGDWFLITDGTADGGGAASPGTPSGNFNVGVTSGDNCHVAEVGFWNAALTDDEIRALSRGISPIHIRRASLLGYWPLFGVQDTEVDLSGNARNLTKAGTPAVVNHAPVGRLAPFAG